MKCSQCGDEYGDKPTYYKFVVYHNSQHHIDVAQLEYFCSLTCLKTFLEDK